MIIAYAPLLREQFNQLYRFGYTLIPATLLVYADYREQPNEIDLRRVAEKLATSNPYEYEEEYLILQVVTEQVDLRSLVEIQIRDVRRVYPLSQRAKEFLESRLDTRINFQPPIFQQALEAQVSQRIWQDAKQAIIGLLHYFDLDGSPEDVWSLVDKFETDIKDGLNARISGIKAHNLVDKGYWAYVIAYDRYEAFPTQTLGYFYDSGHLFGNYKGKPGFTGSGFHQFLEKQRTTSSTLSFGELKAVLNNEPSIAQYRDQVTFGEEGQVELIRGYLITPLFLLSKEQLKSNAKLSDSNLFKYKNELRGAINASEFKVLITLLGCFFGYRKFYDTFYEHPQLPIFKANPDPINWETSEQNGVTVSGIYNPIESHASIPTLDGATPFDESGGNSITEFAVAAKSEDIKPDVTELEKHTLAENREIVPDQYQISFAENGLSGTKNEVDTFTNRAIKVIKNTRGSKTESLSKPIKKTDQEHLNWLHERLAEAGYGSGMPLSEFAAQCKRNQKLAKELLASDSSYFIRKEGKIEIVSKLNP